MKKGDSLAYIAQIFDIVTVAMSAILFFLSLWLWKFFKDSIFDRMCKILIITSVFLLVSSVFCFAMMFTENNEWLFTFHEAFNCFAIVLLIYSVFLLYLAWSRLGKPP